MSLKRRYAEIGALLMAIEPKEERAQKLLAIINDVFFVSDASDRTAHAAADLLRLQEYEYTLRPTSGGSGVLEISDDRVRGR